MFLNALVPLCSYFAVVVTASRGDSQKMGCNLRILECPCHSHRRAPLENIIISPKLFYWNNYIKPYSVVSVLLRLPKEGQKYHCSF